MRKINVGIVGFGMSAQVFHIPFIINNDNFKITKILERSTNKSAEKFPEIKIVRTIEKLLEDKEIELIIITTPNISHYEISKKCLLADKHIVVEKPFTVSVKEADELIELAKQKNRIIAVYHNRRFDGDFLTVKQIIDNKLLGNLVEYEAHFDRFRNFTKNNWREFDQLGAGIVYDLGSHLIDQALNLFGLPKSIRADIRIQRDNSKTADNFEIILNYDTLKVTLKAGMLVREQSPHFILYGTEGSFIKYGLDPQEELLKKENLPIGDDWGKDLIDNWGNLNTNINDLHFKGKIETIQSTYAKFYENVYNVIVHNHDLMIKTEEAKNVIRIIELAIKSNGEKRTIDLT